MKSVLKTFHSFKSSSSPLRKIALPLSRQEILQPQVQQICNDLVITLRNSRSAGLAAPQIGESVRILSMHVSPMHLRTLRSPSSSPLSTIAPIRVSELKVSEDERDQLVEQLNRLLPSFDDGAQPVIFINPKIIAQSNPRMMIQAAEACYSIPDYIGFVKRHSAIRVRFINLMNEECEISLKGFEARVLQHELDHLNGVLFTDHIVNPLDLQYKPNIFPAVPAIVSVLDTTRAPELGIKSTY